MTKLEKQLLAALKYVVAIRDIECLHKHKEPNPCCAKCKADAAITAAKDKEKRFCRC